MVRTLSLICIAAVTVTAQDAVSIADVPKAKKPLLLTSDLSGRDLLFISEAADIGKTLNFLALASAKSKTPELRGFGESLLKSIGAQSAVLNSLAEMRNVKVPAGDSLAQKKYAERFGKLEGNRFDKALLDAFLEADDQALSIYKAAEKSADPTIREFVAQTLPQLRGHQSFLHSLAGIPPQRNLEPVAEGPK